MPRPTRTQPRKVPQQERARATVDAILAATARILVKDGYEAASTNRVARMAGVSVGSLYQYFPSKEALVLEVTRRHLERMLSSMETKLIERMNDPVEVVAPVLVRELIAAHGLDPRLHKVLLEEVPHADKLATMREKDRRLTQLICAYLTLHRDEVALDDLELGAYVLVKAAEALTHAAVIDRPELLGNGALEAQIVHLVLAYVRPSGATSGTRPKRLRTAARA